MDLWRWLRSGCKGRRRPLFPPAGPPSKRPTTAQSSSRVTIEWEHSAGSLATTCSELDSPTRAFMTRLSSSSGFRNTSIRSMATKSPLAPEASPREQVQFCTISSVRMGRLILTSKLLPPRAQRSSGPGTTLGNSTQELLPACWV